MKICCVVIVTYNAKKWLDMCLEPFRNADHDDISIIVIDNASADDTCDIIRNKYPYVRLISNSKNLGFGQANNIGIKWAYDNDFKHVFLLNQDAQISISDLYKICEMQDGNPEYYCLSPIHYSKDGNIDTWFKKNLVDSGIAESVNKNSEHYIYEIKFCNAALWCLSMACIENIGGFSPTFFHYGEDNNYVDRIHYYGKKIGVIPSIKGLHYRENPRSKNTYFIDKFKANYRYMLQELSNPNNKTKNIYLKFYRKIFLKLCIALLTFNYERIKRNFKLITCLIKEHKMIESNKEKSKQNLKLCFLDI
ncbi:MAG: glycosyltransferase family 2 protein [Alphaproteobacteria bacterium]|nr:glycosyltransferase family 2 protein [Alphaproteobacteria bacterium]